jgi:hypothetical protein
MSSSLLLFIYSLFNGFLSSVGIATGYGLDGRGSISDRGKGFVSTAQRPDLFWGILSLLSSGHRVLFPGGKAAEA